MLSFQEIIFQLQTFWSDYGCLILHPYDTEKGAGTMSPHTFLRVLGPEPWNVGYVEPSRRPTDGRYGENPNRLQHYFQFQVILKPSPLNVQDLFIQSLQKLGIRRDEHDIRFIEDNWESPTLGAAGVGWEVWLNGIEITQFTYFQQCGGMEMDPISVEITYGLERIATFIQDQSSVYDIVWHDVGGKRVTYGDLYLASEKEQSIYNFEEATVSDLETRFELYELECEKLIQKKLSAPAYDYCLKCSHTFNLLDARGALSVTERMAMILRVRKLARGCAIVVLGEGENG